MIEFRQLRHALAHEGDLRREIELRAGPETGNQSVGAGPYPAEISAGRR